MARENHLKLLSLRATRCILANDGEASVDLFINAALTATSLALFCYWFRYGCLLILAAKTAHDYSGEVASANQLSFPEVRSGLRKQDATDLDRLHQCLERDFAILAYLLEHSSITSFDTGFEDAMLKIHFRAMSAIFYLTRTNLCEFASDALEEMWLVVAYLANQLGERSLAGLAGGD
jgi:hypothetical protein